MQPMQLMHGRYHTGTGGIRRSSRGHPAGRQGCRDPTQPRVRLSGHACPPHVAPGQVGGAVSGGPGAADGNAIRVAGVARMQARRLRLHTSICMPNPLPAGEGSVRSPICSAAHIISWLVSEQRWEWSREGRREAAPIPTHHHMSARRGAWEDPAACRSWWAARRGQRGAWVEEGSIPMGSWDAAVLQASPWAVGEAQGISSIHHRCCPHFNFAPGQQKSP